MSAPCSAEIQFWTVMQSAAKTIARELKRANKLKALEISLQHSSSEVGCDEPVVWASVERMVHNIMEEP